MKFLVYLMTLLFSTAVAQNPTILQGNYVSNVFGNSNFVLNPNAQTNVANVTTVTATVARSTTTPLVATSEFTVAIGTANGTATWATRAFDAGMKGQNCEARFSYRGFAATSIVQIKQSTNVVASLTLTPATDPRIASINFPCGDLSAATTFVVTDTAILAGTNEIGGIYVGLATNMANVAQAELVVSANRTTTQSITNGVSTTVIFANENNDVYGEYDPATGIFTAKRSGEYFVQSMILYGSAAWTAGNSIDLNIKRDSNVICSQNYRIQYTSTTFHGNQASCHVTITVGQQIKVQTYQDRGSATDLIGTGSAIYNRLQIYRFPSASELVVTPERQNTFGGVSAYGGGSTAITAAAWTNLNNSGAVTRSFYGKASAPSTAGDVAIKIASLPVGTYSVTFTGQAYSLSAASAETQCLFGITDGTSRPAVTSISAVGDATTAVQGIVAPSFSSIFTNTAVQDKTFTVQAYRSTGTGSCNLYADGSRPYLITVTPLDQQSNSALYVQGPVKAAATGAAIPAGYVGEVKHSATIPGCGTAGQYNDGASVSLTPGIWQVTSQAVLGLTTTSTVTNWIVFTGPTTGNSSTWRVGDLNDYSIAGVSVASVPGITQPLLVKYDGTNLFYFANGSYTGSTASASGTIYAKYFRNHSGTCGALNSSITAIRLN
jgi:hypothetical protein